LRMRCVLGPAKRARMLFKIVTEGPECRLLGYKEVGKA
jgi:hypothetical protein